jgi:hypothetical protein
MGFGVLQLVRGREDRASGPEGADTTWLPAGAPARASCATEVVSFPLHAVNAEPRLVVSMCGDVLGGVWYRLKLGGSRPVPDDAYDLIREVRLGIGGQVVERFSGSALGLLARHDPKAACSRLGKELAFPLRLCASRLPLVALAYHEVVVDLALVAGIEVDEHSYEVAYVSLDDAERRALARLTPHRLAVTQKLSLRRRVHSPRPVRLALDLPELRNRVPDVALRVVKDDGRMTDDLLSCALVCRYPGLREEVRYGLDAIMLGRANAAAAPKQSSRGWSSRSWCLASAGSGAATASGSRNGATLGGAAVAHPRRPRACHARAVAHPRRPCRPLPRVAWTCS